MREPSPSEALPRYELAFLTDEWEWEAELGATTAEAAEAEARQALERLVREETPRLACVTVVADGRRVGVWDWVDGQAHWTRL